MRVATLLCGSLLLHSSAMAWAGDFIGDGTATLKYSQYYWRENDGGGYGPNRDEWVQAFQLGFASCWWQDLLGLDYRHAVAKGLNVGSDATSVTNLRSGRTVQSPRSIDKPLEAYLRARWVREEGILSAGYGKRSRRYAIYTDDTSRILPAASIGLDLGYQSDSLTLAHSRIQGFSPRNESGWSERLESFGGQRIASLEIYSGKYVMPSDTRLSFEYAESRDYLRSAFVALEQSIELASRQAVDFSLAHGRQQDAGARFEYAGVRRLYEAEARHDARYLDLTLRYRLAGHSLALSWNGVRGDDFDRLFFARDHGTWNSSGKLYFFFGLRDEEMYKVSGTLDFGSLGVPGLKATSYYAFSNHAYGYNGFSRREFQSLLQYSFEGVLRGLSLAWLGDRFHTRGSPDGVHRLRVSAGPAGIISEHSQRFYLTWQCSF
ncbi:OprD family outer membrane porin [Pseudomonas aeruginosa]